MAINTQNEVTSDAMFPDTVASFLTDKNDSGAIGITEQVVLVLHCESTVCLFMTTAVVGLTLSAPNSECFDSHSFDSDLHFVRDPNPLSSSGV